MNKDETDGKFFPPLSPDGEPPCLSDALFIHDSMSMFNKVNSEKLVETGNHTLTTNSQWGTVFRLDFEYRDSKIPGLINRFISWKGKNGKIGYSFSIGQQASSLAGNTQTK